MDADFLLIRKMKQGEDDACDLFVQKYYPDILVITVLIKDMPKTWRKRLF